MKKTVIQCDCCGVYIPDEGLVYSGVYWDKKQRTQYPSELIGDPDEMGMSDLCGSCYLKLIKEHVAFVEKTVEDSKGKEK